MLTRVEPPYDIPETDDALLAECDVQTFHGSGPGGQSVNTSDSAVRLHHRPSGVTVVCREERSQLQNKRRCLARLRERLEALNAPPPAPRRSTRKSHRVRAGELAAKAQRARLKKLRSRPKGDED
jgi:protein subunit release factor A